MPRPLCPPIYFFLLFCLTATLSCQRESSPLELTSGMHISESVTIKQDTFVLNPQGPDSTVLTISGNDLTIDFNGAVLKSAANPQQANHFWGTGIRILKGKNIRIKNVTVHGFKVGLLATNCDSLQLVDSDFSYNYRQRLGSTPSQESADAWLFDGAAVYLKNCQQALVKNIHVTGGQNGLLIANCQQGLFYNNTIQYNSGLAIGLHHSNQNWVMHNRLDWNVRSYDSGIYYREQNAASISAYPPSNKNVFAYNSATHSNNGIFLQAATVPNQETNTYSNNLVFGNDFSHASQNGVALHAGSNNIIYNQLEDCDYGIRTWQSHHSLFLGNTFRKNNQDMAISEDSTNLIRDNIFDEDNADLGSLVAEYAPEPLADGQDAFLPEGSPRGRQYLLMTEWGPYDFRYPRIWLRSVEGDTYTFVILGPQGNWQLVGGTGIEHISRKRGAVPATVVVQGNEGLSLELKFIGEEATTVFGESVKKGKGILFGWK